MILLLLVSLLVTVFTGLRCTRRINKRMHADEHERARRPKEVGDILPLEEVIARVRTEYRAALSRPSSSPRMADTSTR